MADYDFLPASNGSGDAALMHVNAGGRTIGSTIIPVDSVVNVPAKFIGTYGVLGANGLITSTSKRDFKGHVSGATLVIDGFEPGSTDNGNNVGDIVIIKPNTGWTNRVAAFIKNMTGFGTPEAVTLGAVTAGVITASGVNNSGNTTVGGSITITGTSRMVPVAIASAATIAPSSQVYDVTALAVTASIDVPSFTAANGQSVIIRIRDNGTARAISFVAGYSNVSGLATPTATIANKLLTIGAMYNSATSKWEIQGINQEA